MGKVKIYTASTCPNCTKAKAYLRNNKIPFIERNVQQSEKAKAELLDMGYRTVPVILVDDKEIVGFNKEKLKKIL